MSNSLQPHGPSSPWNSPGQNTGVSSLSLLQGIFPTQGSNPVLPLCRRILYQLSYKGNPRILEWVAYPFSRGIFLTQELNHGLLHCRQILYHLSHQENPRILEWVAYPFSRGIFPTQESNRGLLHYRWILYQLSYQEAHKTCLVIRKISLSLNLCSHGENWYLSCQC